MLANDSMISRSLMRGAASTASACREVNDNSTAAQKTLYFALMHGRHDDKHFLKLPHTHVVFLELMWLRIEVIQIAVLVQRLSIGSPWQQTQVVAEEGIIVK